MIVVVCVDDKNGMMFNNRRQSRDKAQQADLLNWCGDRRLWISPYSAPLFEETENLTVDEAFLEKAGCGDICFVEDCSICTVLNRVETVVLYRWNRRYPADLHFDSDLSDFYSESVTEFPGNSHEKITREIYQRKE